MQLYRLIVLYILINKCAPVWNSVRCTLHSEASGEVKQVYCTLVRAEVGEYEIIYRPFAPGKYHLYVEVDNRNISGAPIAVLVITNVISDCKTELLDMKGPQGITFNAQGDMIVAEYRRHCISIINRDTGEKTLFGSKGSGPEQFNNPCDVAVDDEGNIYVADKKNHRIQKFTSDGKFITAVGRYGSNPGPEFDFPVGIGIHPHTKMIYVAEERNDRIQVFTPELIFHGNLSGKFREPKDVAFDSNGNVYVADNENHQIQVFTSEGKFWRQFGKEGKEKGQLSYPSSISIDNNDVVYVTELHNFRISLFTLKEKFLTSFGMKGNEPGQFNYPRGIAVDENGSIYVSDRGNDRIQVFDRD